MNINRTINFLGLRKFFFAVAVVLMIASLGSLVVKQLNLRLVRSCAIRVAWACCWPLAVSCCTCPCAFR